ncbi:MAG: acyl-CoA dehydrogenase [Gammaproteobacteria bacterium]|nr:acyl-CoA dehydrogenase [Gammaproteobacteria bacterium]
MLALAIFFVAFLALGFKRVGFGGWTVGLGVTLLFITFFVKTSPLILAILWLSTLIIGVIFNQTTLRKNLISNPMLAFFRRALPSMSQTEKDALEAGTVWWDGDLFSGNPDWKKLLEFHGPGLTKEEQAFIDGPVEQLCAMLDDWKINTDLNDLPPEVWKFIKDNGFFGMIIPKEYGGHHFSARAHSEVVMKISSRSVAAAVTVMVPNSLGPAELLLRYGTDAQKNHYLPRLAKGDDIPCFALTSPEAGSDASSIPDTGIVCRQDFNGQKDVLGIRVTWDKRYITLGPVATVLGLAFKLYDPEHLIGEQADLGITCALIPTNHPGVNIGRRHYPLAIAFQNGPNWGKDVFIPMDWVIGGQQQAGKGWRMLMECLAAGRSISLPALSVGGAKFSSLSMGAYARIRKQFKTPIGYFEGIEEPLARMAGYTYMMDAARTLTADALDAGQSPSVISAILKYTLTERMRRAVNDAMDIQGGSAICLGPHNILGKLYHAIPISITVEGANILTRSLIIYGQGAIRCHPYIFKEMLAAQDSDHARASADFDSLFWRHINFTVSNMSRSLIFGLTNGMGANVPDHKETKHYYQQLTRFSAAFAMVSDFAMLTLGGALKRKEKLSGRLADVLGLLYLTSATLKRYEDQGFPSADLPLVRWACEQNLFEIQQALDGILNNLPSKALGLALRVFVFPTGRRFTPPSDNLGRKVARIILNDSEARDRLTKGVFVPKNTTDQVGRMEAALRMSDQVDQLERKLFRARKEGEISGRVMSEMLEDAVRKNLITESEKAFYDEYDVLRKEVIKVDDFAPDAFKLNPKS